MHTWIVGAYSLFACSLTGQSTALHLLMPASISVDVLSVTRKMVMTKFKVGDRVFHWSGDGDVGKIFSVHISSDGRVRYKVDWQKSISCGEYWEDELVQYIGVAL